MPAQTISFEVPRAAGAARTEVDPQGHDTDSLDFESSLRAALAATGGALLFQMHIEREGAREHVAAIRVGSAENGRFFLVILPAGSRKLKIEPVETSNNPLAHIAAAYARLVDVLAIAA